MNAANDRVFPSPAALLVERLDAMHRDGDELTVVTDAQSYASKVLLAIRRPSFSGVLSIDKSEYDGLTVAKILGFADAQAPTAMQRAQAQKATKP